MQLMKVAIIAEKIYLNIGYVSEKAVTSVLLPFLKEILKDCPFFGDLVFKTISIIYICHITF